jgi:hypothetical protein
MSSKGSTRSNNRPPNQNSTSQKRKEPISGFTSSSNTSRRKTSSSNTSRRFPFTYNNQERGRKQFIQMVQPKPKPKKPSNSNDDPFCTIM